MKSNGPSEIQRAVEIKMTMDLPFHTISGDQILQRLSSSLSGLSSEEAQIRLEKFGLNVLGAEEKESLWKKIFEIMAEPMVLLLIGAVIVFFLLGERRDAMIMLLAILPIVSIEFIQEYRTDRTLHALKNLIEPKARVIRDGEEEEIPSSNLVPGDILILRAGDVILADARIIETLHLGVDESSLTGESDITEKNALSLPRNDVPITEQENMVFAGTMVAEGNAKAIVVRTGSNTEYGKISKLTLAVKEEKTPLEKKAGQLTKWLALFGLGITILVVLISLTRGVGLLPSILRGLSVAMAAIPEELPIIFTVFLALGVWQMARKQVLIRKMTAVETLGSVTTICVDKTGTLTKGEMAVEKIFCEGVSVTASSGDLIKCKNFFSLPWLLKTNQFQDPYEKGLQDFIISHPEISQLAQAWEVIQDYPFDPKRKRRSTLLRNAEGRLLLLTRGAPEFVLETCNIPSEKRVSILAENTRFASEGLRVLAFAHRFLVEVPKSHNDAEAQMVFAGLIGFADPVREAAPEAMRRAQEAGIRVIMITGDQPATALAIARMLQLNYEENAITGQELEQLSDEALKERLMQTSIFARVLPEHKLRIVRILKSQGEIVAMTGDGVNDAPALKAADIGIAMGKRGTEVARESSKAVLLDDNFTTIVMAIQEGRRIYDNIQKAINYFSSTKVALLGFVLLNGFLDYPLAFLPLHIVWMELIIDPTSSVVYQAEPVEPDTMKRKPRSPQEPLLSKNLLTKLLAQGLSILAGTFFTYVGALQLGQGEITARTLAFSTLVLSQLLLVLVNRSQEYHFWKFSLFSNRSLVVGIGVTVLLQLLIVYLPIAQSFFRTTALTLQEWLLVLGVAVASTLWVEVVKVYRHRFGERGDLLGERSKF